MQTADQMLVGVRARFGISIRGSLPKESQLVFKRQLRVWLAFAAAVVIAMVGYAHVSAALAHSAATAQHELAAKGVLALTACYLALSEDLTPLLYARSNDFAAASPECELQDELRSQARNAKPSSTPRTDARPSTRNN